MKHPQTFLLLQWFQISFLSSIFLFFFNSPAGIIVTSWRDMDREARDEYLVVVQVKDMLGLSGGYSSSTTVTVSLTDVNDNGPTFQQCESSQRCKRQVEHTLRESIKDYKVLQTPRTCLILYLQGIYLITLLCFEWVAPASSAAFDCAAKIKKQTVEKWARAAERGERGDRDAPPVCVRTRSCATRWMNLIIHTWKDICHDLWKQTEPSQR